MKNKLLIIGGIIIIFIIIGISLIPNNNKNVIIDTQSIQLSTTNVNINAGQSMQINAYILPEDATNKNLIWTSLNTNVASVNNGLITGINPGNCMIYVETENGKMSRIITVTVNPVIVNIDVNKITVSNKDIELFIGDSTTIDYTIEPSNATDKMVAFNVDDRDIVSIDENHIITGLREGNTFITLVSINGIKEKVNITVKSKVIDVTNISLDKSQITMYIGQSGKINATVIPTDATDKMVTWKSSNTNIATVNSNGEVFGIRSGDAIITATSSNGKVASCKVKVNQFVTEANDYYEPPINVSGANSVASCQSDSLRYNIINYNGDDLAFIWLKHPARQLNNALATGNGSGKASADAILQNEINRYGYQNKCMIAANASFFNMSSGSILANVIISKGNVVRNNGYATVIGVTSEGYLNEYVNKPISSLQNDGVMTTFGHSNRLYPQNDSSNDKTNRTVICQINKNNFVLISGSGVPEKMVYDLNKVINISACYNLDGGGSRKLYYKTQNSSMIKRFGGTRAIPDMIYFVEE